MKIIVLSRGEVFADLQAATGLTDGALGEHLKKLTELGYVRRRSLFLLRRSPTRYEPTEAGEQAFRELVRQARELLAGLPPSTILDDPPSGSERRGTEAVHR